MVNTKERILKQRDFVYVIDCWGTELGMQAIVTDALIISIDESGKFFDAVLYGDTYQRYSYSDFGRIIFQTEKEANENLEKIPKPGVKVQFLTENGIEEKILKGIITNDVNGFTDLLMRFEKNQEASIKALKKILI